MNNITRLFALILISCLFYSCTIESKKLVEVNEVSPWCILGFDTENRTPSQRITMLKELGLTRYGFNKGKGHLGEMVEEFQLAKENNIEISSIFLWVNAERDSIGKLSPSNQELLENLKKVDYKPTIWLSFSNNFFEDRSQQQSMDLAIDMVKFVKSKADELGCELAIYNHHGWFGNPYHQVEILEKINDKSISMVYNFHHAHEYVDEFPEIVKIIKPYLSYVNLNGVKKDDEQILPIGDGDHEYDMIKSLIAEGYTGPWGILGHIKTEDVELVLKGNIKGLEALNSKYAKE